MARVKDKYRMSGVYRIRNLINGKIYIGSSTYIKSRKNSHIRKLEKGIHKNKHLQLAYSKYGGENFLFEVIEYCLPNMCIVREQYYLDLYKPYNRNIGYNTRFIAESQLGLKRTEKTRQKISNAKKGIKLTEEHKKSIRKSLIGHSCSQETKNKLREINVGKKMSKESCEKISKANMGRKMSDSHKLAIRKGLEIFNKNHPSKKRVLVYNMNGEFFKEFNSISETAKAINAKTQHICRCLKGHRKTTKGFNFKYAA